MPRPLPITFLAFAVLTANRVSGQEIPVSFSTLESRLSSGATIVVENADGLSIEGILRASSATTLTLQHGRDVVTVRAEDVQRITRKHHPHALRNGAILGFALGFAVGGVWAATADECTFTCFSSLGGVLLFGGLGGGIGLAVGAMTGVSLRSDEVLFDGTRLRAGGNSRLAVPPSRTGLALQLRW